MTEQEQRIAIAEACGAKWRGDGGWCLTFCKGNEFGGQGTIGDGDCRTLGYDIPDYLHDLNAMHEAEDALIELGYTCEFSSCLRRIVQKAWHAAGKRNADFGDLDWQFSISHATAAQRAEAFLRTLGKWKDQ